MLKQDLVLSLGQRNQINPILVFWLPVADNFVQFAFQLVGNGFGFR